MECHSRTGKPITCYFSYTIPNMKSFNKMITNSLKSACSKSRGVRVSLVLVPHVKYVESGGLSLF